MARDSRQAGTLEQPKALLLQSPLELAGGARANGEQSTASWMLTFTDLVALMITFFVMLFAMSQVEQRKWQNLTDALSNNLDLVREVEVALPTKSRDAESVRTLAGTDLNYLSVLLEQHLAAEPLLADALLQRRADRLVVSLPGPLLFASGSAELSPEGARAVFALSGVLRNLENRIEVTGNADPQAPGATFPSNWELSLVRAAQVGGLLAEAGYGRPVVLRGLGHSRFAATAPELELERRRALARRVDIAILEDAGELLR